MSILQEIRDVSRLEQIAKALLKFELGYWAHRLHMKKHLPMRHRIKAIRAEPIGDHREAAVRLRHVLEELGPTFIKLGQLLSLRSDLIPEVFCEEFHKLQDHVAPISYSDVKNMIEKELGKPISSVFKQFEKVPVASASIAQVHRAKLKDGRTVAVKVQRPHIKGIIRTDIDILYHLARVMQSKPEFRNYDPVGVIREFEAYTKNELDFEVEARNAQRFHRNYADSKTVFIPEPFMKYCTKRVMVSEWVNGIALSDMAAVKSHHVNKRKVALNGMKTIFQMIFHDRFFHADSHPGNIFVMKDGRIAYVDFGIVGHVTEELEEKLLRFLLGVMDYDIPAVRKAILDIAEEKGNVDIEGFTSRIDSIIGEWYGASLKESRVTLMIYRIINAATRFDMKMPVDVILLAKALLTMEGTGVELYPDFNMVEEAKPILQKLWAERYAPAKLFKRSGKELEEFHEMVEHLPERTEKLMELAEKGTIGMRMDMRDLNVLREEIDHQSNTRSLALIFSGLVVASAIALLADVEYTLLGFQVSTVGFLGAAVIGALYIAILIRHREYKECRW